VFTAQRLINQSLGLNQSEEKRVVCKRNWNWSKQQGHFSQYYNNNNNDRLTAFDPGQPG